MKFSRTTIAGAVIVDLESKRDVRGAFARFFCTDEFASQGLPAQFVQGSLSRSPARGTLRGMHLQLGPTPEEKLVRCTRGRIYDVILDLRERSATYRQWAAAELDSESGQAIFVPAGCAHGFLTLAPDTELLYLMTVRYDPVNQRGIRWNDPAFAIKWPIEPTVMSERDRSFPDYTGSFG